MQISIDDCIAQLTNIKNNYNPLGKPTHLSQLPDDLKDGVFKGHHKVAKLHTATEFENVKKSFIDEILLNISKR